MNPLTWNIILALIWVSITGDFSLANLLIGMLLGYLILGFALRNIAAFSRYAGKLPKLVRFSGFFLRELFTSNLRVAYDVLTPTHHMRPAVIAVPLKARTDGEITVLTNLISLTPGTLGLDVSSDRKVLYLHVMYLLDEQAVRESIQRLEQRLLEILR